MCSIPVWSMTFTAIFTPGSGSSNGIVFVVSISHSFVDFAKISLGSWL